MSWSSLQLALVQARPLVTDRPVLAVTYGAWLAISFAKPHQTSATALFGRKFAVCKPVFRMFSEATILRTKVSPTGTSQVFPPIGLCDPSRPVTLQFYTGQRAPSLRKHLKNDLHLSTFAVCHPEPVSLAASTLSAPSLTSADVAPSPTSRPLVNASSEWHRLRPSVSEPRTQAADPPHIPPAQRRAQRAR